MERQVTVNGKEYTLTMDLRKYFKLTQEIPDLHVKIFTGAIGPWGELELFAKLANVKIDTIINDPEFKLKLLKDYEYAILEILIPFFVDQGILPENFVLPNKDDYFKMATEMILQKI